MMINATSKILSLTYYQFLVGLRIKQAFFFSLVFPVFIFILFNLIWNGDNDSDVTLFFLTGILCANTVSEGVYSISTVIKQSVSSGFMNYLKKMFTQGAAFYHFLSLILSRLITFILVCFILIVLATLFFNLNLNVGLVVRLLVSMFIGITTFSLIGLVFAFTGIKNMETSANHFIFYIIVFSSDAYYFASQASPIIKTLSQILPLNNILQLARGDHFNAWALCLWLIIPCIIFIYFFKRLRLSKN